jgi:release factor glutamine methyltransferase
MRRLLKRIISPFLQKASAAYLKKPRKYSYKTISVWVEPTVFPPFITLSTKIFLEFIETLPLQDKRFLELGCGCGIIAILAAKKGAKVTATDINPVALKALEKNAAANKVTMEIKYADLFNDLGGNDFDYIFINPPYYPKKPASVAESAWFCGENFEYFENLFYQLPTYTVAGNKTFMILSQDCALELIERIANKNNMVFALVLERKVAGEKNYIYEVSPRPN